MASAAQIAKAARDPVSDPHVALLVFQEDGQDSALRAVIDNADLTSTVEDGVTERLFSRSSISLPWIGSGQQTPTVRIEMSNVTRTPGRLLLLAQRQIGVRMIVVDRAAPNVAILDTHDMLVIRGGSVSAEAVSVELQPRADALEPVPGERTRRQWFPGPWFIPK